MRICLSVCGRLAGNGHHSSTRHISTGAFKPAFGGTCPPCPVTCTHTARLTYCVSLRTLSTHEQLISGAESEEETHKRLCSESVSLVHREDVLRRLGPSGRYLRAASRS
ncbi:hypothetical protein DNTS_012399 [Danionella cerebrum]|uniref:Uncharacterized protein n=1 Tax=Danionella cerebrum TaxID=2873325 RepID=A0A553N0R3_9TELE|nr:hypothetical protein DNTS_012399 [Danionella translucida]